MDKGTDSWKSDVKDSPVVFILKDAKEWTGTEILGAKHSVSYSCEPLASPPLLPRKP